MAVTMPREKWTDERLDDLSAKMDQGFADTKAEMRAGFVRLDRRIDGLDEDIKSLTREMNARFDTVNRNMIAGFFVIAAAIIGSNAALIASNVF